MSKKKFKTNEIFSKIFFEQKMLQTEFADITGVGIYSIHKWLANKTELKYSKLALICEKLEMNVELKIK